MDGVEGDWGCILHKRASKCFQSRMVFFLNMHNEAVHALRFPANSGKEKEVQRGEERQQQEEELAKHIAEDDDDEF